MRYPVAIHKDTDSDYGVTVPDLPGCFSAGVTLDGALVNAREAIECHLEGLLSAGEALPQPGSMDEHRQSPDYAAGTWALADIDLSRLDSRVRRINISLPERVLAVIDEEARRACESRSGFLAKAASSISTGTGRPPDGRWPLDIANVPRRCDHQNES